MRRILALSAVAAAWCGVAPSVAAAVTVRDNDDSPVLLDLRLVAMTSAPSKRVDVTFTTYDAWDLGALAAMPGGPSGSFCAVVWTKRSVTGVADYLVCAAPAGDGTRLAGSVLREPSKGGLSRKVGTATVTRPSTRSVRLRFALSALASPTTLRFAAEATQALGCPFPGCVDRAPNRRATTVFTPTVS